MANRCNGSKKGQITKHLQLFQGKLSAMQQILQEKVKKDLRHQQETIDLMSNSQALRYAGLTLREYFQRTEQVNRLNKIEEQAESESDLECVEGSRNIHHEPNINKNPQRRLKSLTRLKDYQLQLQKTAHNQPHLQHKFTPHQKVSLNMDPKLPYLQYKSCSPQINNLKKEVLNKFRKRNCLKTEFEQRNSQERLHLDHQIIALQQSFRKSCKQPILIHVGRKKVGCNSPKPQISSNRYSQKAPEAFLLTFNKNKFKKHSEANLVESFKFPKKD